ncbi:MAG: Type II secretion system protein G [Actinobacteria bacterium]|nr:Type II secretion system protein G [Actinomycetota bacterium]
MKKGFTLIEILVVVAIVGLLSSVVLVGLGPFRARGRDARRIADLRQTQNALELYFVRNGLYPNSINWPGLTSALIGARIGVNSIPNDPTSGWNYGYCRAAPGNYVLGAHLEDTNNPALRQYPSGTTFPCDPSLSGTPSNPSCSTDGAITNKFCLML